MRKQQSPGLRHVSVLNLPTQEQDNLICSRCVFPLGHSIIGLLVSYSSVAITHLCGYFASLCSYVIEKLIH